MNCLTVFWTCCLQCAISLCQHAWKPQPEYFSFSLFRCPPSLNLPVSVSLKNNHSTLELPTMPRCYVQDILQPGLKPVLWKHLRTLPAPQRTYQSLMSRRSGISNLIPLFIVFLTCEPGNTVKASLWDSEGELRWTVPLCQLLVLLSYHWYGCVWLIFKLIYYWLLVTASEALPRGFWLSNFYIPFRAYYSCGSSLEAQ